MFQKLVNLTKFYLFTTYTYSQLGEQFGVSSGRDRNHKYKGEVTQQNLCPSDSGRLDMALTVQGHLPGT